MESALYVGRLRHHRFTPKEHSFEYPVFLSLLDVDAIPEIMQRSPLSSYGRWNVVSYFERDHFGDPAKSLRERIEVDNTFGESHNYWLTPENERKAAGARRYSSEKRMHVSPFMGMDLDYDWIFTEPGERLVAHMNTLQDGKPFFDATLRLQRREWTRAELHRVLAAYPLMTARVMGAIHWEALKLWIKRVPVFAHPAKEAPAELLQKSSAAGATKGNVPG